MDRKRFLNQLGGASLLSLLPLSSAKAFIKENALSRFFSKAKIVRDDEGTQLRIFGNPQFHKVVGTDTGEQILNGLMTWLLALAYRRIFIPKKMKFSGYCKGR